MTDIAILLERAALFCERNEPDSHRVRLVRDLADALREADRETPAVPSTDAHMLTENWE